VIVFPLTSSNNRQCAGVSTTTTQMVPFPGRDPQQTGAPAPSISRRVGLCRLRHSINRAEGWRDGFDPVVPSI
jgi:hypothetical protein